MASSKLCVFATLVDPTGHKIHDDLCGPALAKQGWRLESWPWTSDQDWQQADLVVLRSCYDYWEKPELFEAWLKRLDDKGIPIINPPETVLWNSNKKYLFELEAQGCATLKSLLVESPTERAAIQEFLESCPQSLEFVCKPLVGAGGFEMERLSRQQTRALEVERPSLLQPFEAGITDGEWSAVFFGGEPSHVVKKTAKPGEYRVQDTHGGQTRAASWEECPGLLKASRQVARAIETLGFLTPVYARYDFVLETTHGQPILMEAELIEPTLFLEHQLGSAERLVEALISAWEQGQH